MALRVAALAPYTLQLRSLQLENLAGGWSLLHTSGEDLQAAPRTMRCDDVHLSAFSLCSPASPGAVQLGSLRLAIKRVEAPDGEQAPRAEGDKGEDQEDLSLIHISEPTRPY